MAKFIFLFCTFGFSFAAGKRRNVAYPNESALFLQTDRPDVLFCKEIEGFWLGWKGLK
jgi:hypothetical protein